MKILHYAKKSLGQNFLVDTNIIKKIVEIGKIDKNKTILEIGAGSGNLTQVISSLKPKKIIAVEKDMKLCSSLIEKFKENKNVDIINHDILKIINKMNFRNGMVVFGNLPYNISTKILSSLILLKKWPPYYDVLIFMFQKEVANRIIAKTCTKEFGRLSVLANWRMDVRKHFDISRNCFFPKPKINSTLLSFRPKKNYLFPLKDPKTLENVTRILFSNRRKMVNKNFKKLFKNKYELVKNFNINLNKRPEELSNETFYKIAIAYEELFS